MFCVLWPIQLEMAVAGGKCATSKYFTTTWEKYFTTKWVKYFTTKWEKYFTTTGRLERKRHGKTKIKRGNAE